jgi:hypothetical protein
MGKLDSTCTAPPREGARRERRGESAQEAQEVPLGVDVVQAEVEDKRIIDEPQGGGIDGVVLHVPRRSGTS